MKKSNILKILALSALVFSSKAFAEPYGYTTFIGNSGTGYGYTNQYYNYTDPGYYNSYNYNQNYIQPVYSNPVNYQYTNYPNYTYPNNNYYYNYNPVSVSAVVYSATTKSATNISAYSATFNGDIYSNNSYYSQGAQVYFEYGVNGNLNLKTTPATIYGSGSINAIPQNLSCGTTYAFRAIVNDGTIHYGDTLYFTTTYCPNLSYGNYQPVYNPYYQNGFYNPTYGQNYWSNYSCKTSFKKKSRR